MGCYVVVYVSSNESLNKRIHATPHANPLVHSNAKATAQCFSKISTNKFTSRPKFGGSNYFPLIGCKKMGNFLLLGWKNEESMHAPTFLLAGESQGK